MSEYMGSYEEYIAKSRYARYLESDKRREEWEETVSRYLTFMTKHLEETNAYVLDESLYKELHEAIFNMEVMPSMRSVMTAGKALKRDNTAGYNCAYMPVDDVKSFDEAMYILLCGTGVGFSVERQYVSKLPDVPDELYESETTVVVA